MHASKFRRITASMAVLASVALVAAGCGSDDEESTSDTKDTKTTATETTDDAMAEDDTMAADKTIVGLAAANPDLSTLVKAATAAGLVPTLDGTDEFTVFAPTNEAFAKVPKATLDALLAPAGKEDLVGVLTYHAVPGKVMAADLKDGQMITTVNGAKLQVKIDDAGNVTVGGAKVTTADVAATNGVVHVIDTVLIPPAKPAATSTTPATTTNADM